MGIDQAKKELYGKLRQFPEVTGAGIQEKNGREIIVVFLTKDNSKVVSQIPKTYKGNTVKTEIRAVAKPM
ncbi:MAG TPA: hypothetical protein VGH64_17600 [Puia sp.]